MLLQITADGEQALCEWLVGPDGALARFAVYFPFDASEREALSAAALEAFGPEWWALLEPNTVSGQELPELAFTVFADDPRGALSAGMRRFAELRHDAGLAALHYAATDVARLDGLQSRFGAGA
jgi:hypothetical protein